MTCLAEISPAHLAVVFNGEREKLFSAPAYDRNREMAWSDWGGDVYRYYGVQPYWTMDEEEAAPTMGEPEAY